MMLTTESTRCFAVIQYTKPKYLANINFDDHPTLYNLFLVCTAYFAEVRVDHRKRTLRITSATEGIKTVRTSTNDVNPIDGKGSLNGR